ncbi:thioesterase superfamily protein [Cupriavidus gilardii J11]|uniref:Thioesterase superfamily protein n=1 Tax=Cupriavidus gilardii J11 TaxID=936133 RepID=A0A562BU12_9BURK|nr:thioesterase family protein [Cupriavidus gilardii]TWG88682.1 thioesterase superfamily protein [Cupriavidus gilardii J11]
MPSEASVFTVDGDAVVPTGLARGPWHPGAQHGGAPGGLLAAMADRAMAGEPGWTLVRLTLEFLRPVPVAPLRAIVEPQPGGSVRRVAVGLFHDDVPVVRGVALFMRERELGLTASAMPPTLPSPAQCRDPIRIPGMAEQTSFHYTAMESRVASGDVGAPGPAAAWFRLAVPLVEGWPQSAAARAVAAADFGNGISWAVPLDRYVFANADLTVYLHRVPKGEWVAVESETTVQPNGVGLTRSTLHDEHGPIGVAQQSLLIKARDAGR